MSDYKKYPAGSEAIISKIVEENLDWAGTVAKTVARAWNMDWQLDGLDGAAYEALHFCAGRFDPEQGVPFRGYARRRIHEAATEQARKSKAWQKGTGTNSPEEQEAREVSAALLDIYPELREGLLPEGLESIDEMRNSVRQLVMGASLVSAFKESSTSNPEIAVEYKRIAEKVAELEPVHQEIIWAIYWKGQSLRSLAEEWKTDDLSVIREHKELINYLAFRVEGRKDNSIPRPKVRRGLKSIAIELKRKKAVPPFAQFAVSASLFIVVVRFLEGTW